MKNSAVNRYRIRFFILLFLIFCVSCSENNTMKNENKTEPDQNIWVFFMAGQSNMAGRGTIEAQDLVTNNQILTINSESNWIVAREPLHFYESASGLDCGMSFAQELLKHVPDSITIIMMPCAVGGSSVLQWLNDEEHRDVKLLSNFREKVQLSKQKGTIKGILWHQGEANANAFDLPFYKEVLLSLFSKFRASVENDKLPIIMGEIGRFAKPQEKAEYFEAINQIIRTAAAENDNLYFISSEGLEDRGDHLHFNSEAQRELGKRYAQKWMKINLVNEL